ncbi:hypothetical protein PFISCL1PPCAC_7801, partial [Pristionchus fissidentatus]
EKLSNSISFHHLMIDGSHKTNRDAFGNVRIFLNLAHRHFHYQRLTMTLRGERYSVDIFTFINESPATSVRLQLDKKVVVTKRVLLQMKALKKLTLEAYNDQKKGVFELAGAEVLQLLQKHENLE